MKRHVDALVRAALSDAVGGGAVRIGGPIAFRVEAPRHAAFGDLSCDVGLVLARALGDSPHRLAMTVVDRLHDVRGWLADVTVDGPGFVNFRFAPAFWRDTLREALAAGAAYGRDSAERAGWVRIAVLGGSEGEPRTLRATAVAEALVRLLDERGWQADGEPEAGTDLAVGVLAGEGAEALAGFRAGLPAGTPLRVLTVAPMRTCRNGAPERHSPTPTELRSDSVPFHVLLGRADRPIEIDLALSARRGTDNPADLVAFARRRLADAVALAAAVPAGPLDLAALDHADVEVLRVVAAWPDVLELAAMALEPHRIALQAVEAAMAVHRWVNRHRLLSAGRPPAARVALAVCLEGIMSRAMAICGMPAVEE